MIYFLKVNLDFEKRHSMDHAVLEIIDRISSELDVGHTPIAIFLDLSKACDTLDHKTLLYINLNIMEYKMFL